METKKYLIDDLSEITGYSRRTIRYYIQEGLLEPPAGRGRGGFYYDSHVKQLLKIKELQEQGIAVSSIASLLKEKTEEPELPKREVVVRYGISPGIELVVGREIEMKEQRKIAELIRIAKSIMKGVRENES